jgi:hypothetical protein
MIGAEFSRKPFISRAFALVRFVLALYEGAKMGQDLSVSYNAVKRRVNRLIEHTNQDGKTPEEARISFVRWWNLLHPLDRPIARKYLIAVVANSDQPVEAVLSGFTDLKDLEPHPPPVPSHVRRSSCQHMN